MGEVWGRLLTPTEMKAALKGPNFASLKRLVAQDVLGSVKEQLSPELVQRALDKGGGTNKCWGEIFKMMDVAFKDAGLNIRTAVPCPHEQRECLKAMNEGFEGMGAFIVEEDAEDADDAEKIMDNVQMDVTKLLQTLVYLYI